MEGYYYDPKHGACLRRIRRVDQSRLVIDGVYGDDEPVSAGHPWTAHVHVLSSTNGETDVIVDFAGKQKRRKLYRAVYANRYLHWDDGNVWVQMFTHSGQF